MGDHELFPKQQAMGGLHRCDIGVPTAWSASRISAEEHQPGLPLCPAYGGCQAPWGQPLAQDSLSRNRTHIPALEQAGASLASTVLGCSLTSSRKALGRERVWA